MPPWRHDIRWFKHDTRSLSDAKIERLIMDFGIEGYGLYFACVEIIAGNLSKENITFELEHDAPVLANKFKMDTLKVEKIMKLCVELGLFEFNSVNGRISCPKIMKRMDEYTTRSPEIKAIANQLSRQCPDNVPIVSGADKKRREEIRIDKITDIKDGADASASLPVPVPKNKYSCDLFKVPEPDYAKHQDAYPGVNLASEYKKMSAWLSANPQKRPKNYPRFINNWLAREQDRVAMRGSKQAPAPFRNRNVAAEQVEDMMRAGKTFDDIFPEKVK